MPARTYPLTVRLAGDRSALRRFVDLPVGLYRGRPGFVPPLRGGEQRGLRRLDGGSLLLAWRGNDVVGRVAAWIDPRVGGCFGWLDVAGDDDDALTALLAAAIAAVEEDGADAMVGPLRWPLDDAPGVLVDDHDRPPVIGCAWNPPGLVERLTAAGCAVASDLCSWTLGVHAQTERGERSDLADTLAWADELSAGEHRGRERTDDERRWWTKGVGSFADPELARVMRDADGAVTGAAVAVPDFNEVLIRLAGGLGPRGIAGVMRAARRRGWRTARLLAAGADTVDDYRSLVQSVARYESLVLGPWPDDDIHRAHAHALGARPDRHWQLFRRSA